MNKIADDDLANGKDDRRVIAVIPVHGRLPLLEITIRRLYQVNKVYAVICVGGSEEKQTCLKANAEFIEFKNTPLGAKWNRGFMEAKKYFPDFCLYMGSSDWVSENWIKELIGRGDLAGKADCNFVDLSAKHGIRVAHWGGYNSAERKGEPNGAGRLLSEKFLDKIDWRPFINEKDHSMDWAMYRKAVDCSASITTNSISSQVLSISSDKWMNKHKFSEHWDNDKRGDVSWLGDYGFLDDIMELKNKLQ